MMKKDHNFRLPKEIKRILSSSTRTNSYEYKNLMIEAIITGSRETPREKKKNRNKSVVEVPSEE
jgi:hypothetical protein